MNMKHTPGTWHVVPTSNPNNGTAWRDIVTDGTPFAPSYIGSALEHDARLIAAAPDMLAALKFALVYLGDDHTDDSDDARDARNVICAAIAKAEGAAS